MVCVIVIFFCKDKTFTKLVFRVENMSTLDDAEQWSPRTEWTLGQNLAKARIFFVTC